MDGVNVESFDASCVAYVNSRWERLKRTMKGTAWPAAVSMWDRPEISLTSKNTDPLHHVYPRILWWLPHRWASKDHAKPDQVLCPHCGKPAKQKGKAIRRVYDIDDDYYLFSHRYACVNGCEETTFNLFDEIYVKSLPRSVQSALPCVVTPHKAVDLNIVRLLRSSVVKGGSFKSLEQELQERRSERWDLRRCAYWERMIDRKQTSRPFPDCALRGPSNDYLRLIYITDFYNSGRADFNRRAMQCVDGTVLSADHSR
jgi:hypothetical protein